MQVGTRNIGIFIIEESCAESRRALRRSKRAWNVRFWPIGAAASAVKVQGALYGDILLTKAHGQVQQRVIEALFMAHDCASVYELQGGIRIAEVYM